MSVQIYQKIFQKLNKVKRLVSCKLNVVNYMCLVGFKLITKADNLDKEGHS